MGVNVYICAGNYRNNVFNTYNLAKGAINVAALNADGTIHEVSNDNSLVNSKKLCVFPVTRTDDGIDFTGDGTTDILYRNLSSVTKDMSDEDAKNDKRLNIIEELIGHTSLATSIAIVEDFNPTKRRILYKVSNRERYVFSEEEITYYQSCSNSSTRLR